ncbi:MAG TPA: GAP family protein [Microlunatus sp.]
MLSVLGHLLPIAVAAALSSIPITATIGILLSPNRERSALPFLIGWVLGMAVVVTAGVLSARILPIGPSRAPNVAIGIAEIVVGVLILLLAAYTWHRAAPDQPREASSWLDRVGSMGPLGSFGSGLALNLRPKGLLLGAAAGLAVAGGSLRPAGVVAALALYLVVATSTVAGPIIATLVAPDRMRPRLTTASDWLVRNRRVVTVIVMIFAGVVIVGAGILRLI